MEDLLWIPSARAAQRKMHHKRAETESYGEGCGFAKEEWDKAKGTNACRTSVAELDECPYEWACSRTAGFVLFHPAGHYLCWLLMFPRANLGIQSHQDTKMWLLATCWRRGCLHRDYIPKRSLAKRNLPLSELIGIRGVFAGRNMQCTSKGTGQGEG